MPMKLPFKEPDHDCRIYFWQYGELLCARWSESRDKWQIRNDEGSWTTRHATWEEIAEIAGENFEILRPVAPEHEFPGPKSHIYLMNCGSVVLRRLRELLLVGAAQQADHREPSHLLPRERTMTVAAQPRVVKCPNCGEDMWASFDGEERPCYPCRRPCGHCHEPMLDHTEAEMAHCNDELAKVI